MADIIQFTGVILRSFSRKPSGGTANFSANMSTKLMQAMAWHELPDSETGADLTGDVQATAIVVRPATKEMRHHQIDFAGGRLHSFKAQRREVEGKKDKGSTVEVFFKVKFSDPNGCSKLESYMLTIGEAKGTMTASYAAQTGMFTDPDAEKTAPANQGDFSDVETAAAPVQ